MFPTAPPDEDDDLPPSYEQLYKSVASRSHISRPEAKTTQPQSFPINKSIETEASGSQATYGFSVGESNSSNVSHATQSSAVHIAPRFGLPLNTQKKVFQTKNDFEIVFGKETVFPIRPSHEQLYESVASQLHISRPEAGTTQPQAPAIEESVEAETSGSQGTPSHGFSVETSNSSNESQPASSSTMHIATQIRPSPYTPNQILQIEDDIIMHSGKVTVCPTTPFNSEMDAKSIENAMKSGPNRESLITILCHRSTMQRQQIVIEYRDKFMQNLFDIFQENFVDNFGIVLQSLVQTPIMYLVTEVHYAVINDHDYLSDLLFYLSNDEMEELKKAYVLNHMVTLSDSIDKYILRGTFKHVLKKIVEGKRDESYTDIVNNHLVKEDLRLFHAPPDYVPRYDQNNKKLCDMFATRNWKHIKSVADAIDRRQEYSLEKIIKLTFANNLGNLYCGIIQYAQNKHLYFANSLKRCMKGLGTNDRELIRIIVSRCEIDLITIKNEFNHLTNNSLKNWIKDDTSGFYKYILYELIGEPKKFGLPKIKYLHIK